MSPEQARAERELDRRSDVWALGAVAWELITGRPLFQAPRLEAVLFRIVAMDLGEAFEYADSLLPGSGSLLRGCLERDVTRRTTDLAEVGHGFAALAVPEWSNGPDTSTLLDLLAGRAGDAEWERARGAEQSSGWPGLAACLSGSGPSVAVDPYGPTLDFDLSAEQLEAPEAPNRPGGRRRSRGLLAAAGVLGLGGLALLWMQLAPAPAPASEQSLETLLAQPFQDFVMEWNVRQSERKVLRRVASWDAELLAATAEETAKLSAAAGFYARMDQVFEEYGEVVDALRAADLPEVLAGIPWVESSYQPELQSVYCAKGLWQFMPETGQSYQRRYGASLRVADCRFKDAPDELWTPPADVVAYRGFDARPYLRDRVCRIPERRGCAVDERTDVRKSTAAAIAGLQAVWSDPMLGDSGAGVQATILSHLLGYEPTGSAARDIVGTFTRWAEDRSDETLHTFVGASFACGSNPDGPEAGGTGCEGPLTEEARSYVPAVFAAHFAAVCYFAANYGEHPSFSAWRKYEDGYCRALPVPSRSEAASNLR